MSPLRSTAFWLLTVVTMMSAAAIAVASTCFDEHGNPIGPGLEGDAGALGGVINFAALPALPANWPTTNLEIGMSDGPGGASTMAATADFGFRYQ